MKKIWDMVRKDLWIVLLDIIAVNLSYYLALLIRFFVAGELRAIANNRYVPAWASFAPFYTVLAIIIFIAFKLYGGMWRYAGINDMNRIILGSLSASVLHIEEDKILTVYYDAEKMVIGGILTPILPIK